MGRMTKVEEEAIIELRPERRGTDVQRMSAIMHRSTEAIKELVLAAMQKWQERAADYADIHFEAAKQALEDGDLTVGQE